MSSTTGSIISDYLRLKNRQALEELREHRRQLRDELEKRRGSFDATIPMHVVDADIVAIEAALATLTEAKGE
jgi:hypothetical protein